LINYNSCIKVDFGKGNRLLYDRIKQQSVSENGVIVGLVQMRVTWQGGVAYLSGVVVSLIC
jgi:hypothetical protein